jgi:hypothetical protein
MNPILKNTLALFAGVVVGGLVNMGIVMISGSIIPPPEGADNTTVEGLKESMHLFEPEHFFFPFLAHALGTLTGAWITARIAASYQILLALVVGCFFLIGGIYAVMLLPSPLWFSIVDLVGAYLPMGYLGAILGKRKS